MSPQRLLLDELLDEPTFEVEVGGRTWRFGELPLAALARLQSWIRANTPHPVEAIAGRLAGLAGVDRERLLDRAAAEARDWPPPIGSNAASAALLGNEPGVVEVLYEGLIVHQPDATRADARSLARALERHVKRSIRAHEGPGAPAGALAMARLFAVLFGTAADFDDAVEDARPKAEAAGAGATTAPTGG